MTEETARQEAIRRARDFFEKTGRLDDWTDSVSDPDFYLQDGEVVLITTSGLVPIGLMCAIKG